MNADLDASRTLDDELFDGPVPSRSDVIGQFITALYGTAERGELSFNYVKGEYFRSSWHGLDVVGLAEGARRKRGEDVWLPIGSRRHRLPDGKRGGGDDVLDVYAFVVDIDYRCSWHQRDGLPPDLDAAHQLLADFALAPSVVVRTGGGLQPWWFAAEPWPAADAAAVLGRWGANWRELARRRGWQVDSTASTEHVFRLAGTTNTKARAAVEIVHADWERRFGLDDIDEMLVDEQVPPRPKPERRERVNGEQLVGDRYNERTDAGDLLTAEGFVLSHQTRAGDRHYYAPHRAQSRDRVGATVYADGHATIWSETFTGGRGIDPAHGYDPFGLFARLRHGGDFSAARRAITQEESGRSASNGHPETGDVHDDSTELATPANTGDRAPVASPLNGADGRHYTDLGNADRLIAAHGDHVRYVPRWGRWIVYDGGRWRLDHGDTLVAHLAGSLGRQLLDWIGAVYGDERRTRELLQWVRRSESAAGIAATLTVAASRPGVAVDHEALDADPWLLNLRNGTLDLRGRFRAHDAADLLTLQASVAYVDGVPAPRWLLFLERILPDETVRRFVQRLAGLALLGDQPEHVLPICLGGGANGKSTLTKVLATVLGEYAVVASRDVLLALKHDTHPTAKADLFRRRLAHSGELPPGARLDEAQVKELTGGDRIKARRMREDFWEFSPSHLLWLHANHRPSIEGTDDGIWRRVLLIPFNIQVPPSERDPRLAERITRDESSGVLNWMLEGLADYATDGLQTPDAVTAATARYRTDSDTVAAFLAESGYQFDPVLDLPAGDLLAAHGDWWQAIGATEPEKAHYQKVVGALKERGVTAGRTKSRGRFWRGIGVRGDNG